VRENPVGGGGGGGGRVVILEGAERVGGEGSREADDGGFIMPVLLPPLLFSPLCPPPRVASLVEDTGVI